MKDFLKKEVRMSGVILVLIIGIVIGAVLSGCIRGHHRGYSNGAHHMIDSMYEKKSGRVHMFFNEKKEDRVIGQTLH